MSILGEIGFALIGGGNTKIDRLIPHVVVEEIHRDSLVTTEHPVELGAAITDHAFLRPKVVEIRCGWSDSTFGSVGAILQPYKQLQQLMEKREPFTITSPRRQYKNMLPTDINVVRDVNNENILSVAVAFRELIIVQSKTTGGTSQSAGEKQASPENNAGTTDTGQRSTMPGTEFAGPFNPGSNTDFLNGGSDAYKNTVPGDGFYQGSGFTSINAGSMGSASDFGKSWDSGGLAGFDEMTITGPGLAPQTIPGPGLTAGPALTAPTSPFGSFNPGQYRV